MFSSPCNVANYKLCVAYYSGYARDATGKWQVIVQTESLPQRVAIDLCHSPEKPCNLCIL